MSKLSVSLGVREKKEKSFQAMLDDMISKFKNKQGLFIGLRQTYVAEEGFADEPNKRQFVNVASTVAEQLGWLKEHTTDYFNTVLSIEKTNAKGVKAHLIVDGKDWGEYTTLELLRLKSIMDGKLRHMIKELPIRKEDTIWKLTTDPVYEGRENIFESPLDEGYLKTTLKTTIIVEDPHADKPGRAPIPAQIDKTVNIGKFTKQEFSGAMTNLERANIEVRFNTLYTAIIEALENANSVEVEESDLGSKFINYLF